MQLQLVTQRGAHARQELVHAEGFCDVVVGAKVQRFDLAGLVATARQHDNRDGIIATADHAQQLVALDVRKAEVENDDVGAARQKLQGRLAVGGLENLVALRAEPHAQQFANRRLVVDHEGLEGRSAHWPRSSGLVSVGSGSGRVQTAPARSVRFAATMAPPIASTKPREIARPRPVPARTWSPFCARWNLSKMCSSSDGGMPSPSSITCRCTAPWSRQPSIRTVVPAGAYFAALSRRLNSTCSNSTASSATMGKSLAISTSTRCWARMRAARLSALPTISPRSCRARFGVTAPDSSLVMSSRLAMNRFN